MHRLVLQQGKVNPLVDGQLGSSGKGLYSEFISSQCAADFYISALSPNAGHTFMGPSGEFCVAKQLPVGGILHRRSTIYLTAGSIINPGELIKEINRFNIDPERVYIHPRAAIITQQDIEAEKDSGSSVAKIASTQSGVGAALARKVLRSAVLAKDCPELLNACNVGELDVMRWLDDGCTALMETAQGFDLGIDSGLSYPHCTSRDVTISSCLANAQVHPSYLGKTFICLRAYPIRVGHLYAPNGDLVGDSGPFAQDSRELTWDDLEVAPEKTTVTGRVRRVATFSIERYERMLHHLRPDVVFLNFSNYIRETDLDLMARAFTKRCPDFLGFGRTVDDIVAVGSRDEALELLATAAGERERCAVQLRPRCVEVPQRVND